nr:SPOR domain-containing protein [Pelagibaculum spongiae]
MSANTPTVISNSLDGKSEEKYWLQLGAFSEKARAMALIKTLAKQNTEWPLFVEQSKKDQLWRVKLGPVKQSAQAEAYKQQLQAQGVSVHSVR